MLANLKFYAVSIMVIAALIGGVYLKAYYAGWNAHSAKVNRDYEQKRQQSELKQAKSTTQVNQVKVVTETKYKTIYRDVVKYVSDPNRTKSDFDDNYQRLRQSALDADTAISRDASGTVRITEQSTKEQ